MKLKDKFWEFCKDFVKGHGLWTPAPEVKKKLTEKGYQIDPPLETPFGKADMGRITSPGGIILSHLFANRAAVRQYKEDYRQAVEEVRQEKNGPPGNKPSLQLL